MVFASVAILVDADNVPSSFAGQILRHTKKLGPAYRRNAYGTLNAIQAWSEATSFRPIYAGPGKNSSDLLLSIDAMQLALCDGIEAFVIVSSDGDFTHIAEALRGKGRHVLGLGEKKAPDRFRRSCTEFLVLTAPKVGVDDKELGSIDAIVRAILREHDEKGLGLPVTRLNELARKAGAIKISEQKEKTWPKYLAARPDLYDLFGIGSVRRVRIASKRDSG